ncbi:MAG TPA: NAD(P)/FAD-dependent oxidoreductase [Sediminibacterium sp.]|nr:NAD(P)/FAD-dependent oxidoreductase [Sediminibacterium sp.]
MKPKKLIVIGGGAAGFFCAINAARSRPGLQVVILEKTGKLLGKVRASGGGRCNVTHACFEIPELVRYYPRGQQFLKKAFHWFHPKNTIDWFAERGVILKTEADGRMFPVTDRSETIVQCLLQEADKWKVSVQVNQVVTGIDRLADGFEIKLQDGQKLAADYVCIASGGYAQTNLFNWLLTTGHTVQAPVPSLFTFNMPGNSINRLMGISLENVRIKLTGSKLETRGPLLITHWGFSGPAVLKLSAWGARELAEKAYRFQIQVNWLGEETENSLRERWQTLRNQYASQPVGPRNPFGLPNRFWQYLLEVCGIQEDQRWGEFKAAAQQHLIRCLTAQSFDISGKTTFKEEFVTCGGISLSEIDPNTMQSKKLTGLYFAGEVMDVDGLTGGFNFQHAWTSAWIAAKNIASVSSVAYRL